MGKEQIRKKRAEYLLRLQLEENNSKSPDILTAVVTAQDQMEAWRIAAIFEEVTGDDLPVDLDKWERSVRPPVELYFVFNRKRDQGRFLRKMSREFPEKDVEV